MSLIKNTTLLIFSLLIVGLSWFVPRGQFLLLMLVYGSAFGIYLWLLGQHFSRKIVLWVGVLLRLSILFSFPLLSDDIFRFVWDGRLLVAGEDPFVFRPSEWMALTAPPAGIDSALHDLIYADYYSVYPPIHQFVFWLSAKLTTSIYSSIFILKSILVASEIALLFILAKRKDKVLSRSNLLAIYALNPLVLLEVSGNGHFEGLLVLFLILSIIGLLKGENILSGIFFGLAIATKLLPLMLLPIIWRYLPKRSVVGFFTPLIVVNIMLWVPFIWMGSLSHMMESIWLYFENFEFNASVFYILKWWVPISWRVGLLTNALSLLVIGWLTFRQKELNVKQLLVGILVVWTAYLLNAAIVHPWYLIPLLVFGALVNIRYGLIWTGLVFLSYSHYWSGGMTEHVWLIRIEYALLGLFMFREYLWFKKRILRSEIE